jgi:hypothetical protein
MDLSFGAADESDQPLPVTGFKGTPEEIERQWFDQVYRGRGDSMPQLTWRAVLMGSCLGAVLSLTNLYIGLKAGWGFGGRHYRLHLVVCDLDELAQSRSRPHADDYP